MTECYLLTCACVVLYPEMILIEQCKTHNTAFEALTHNRTFNSRHGRNPTENQRDMMSKLMDKEKKKPQFQRRK